MRPIEMFIRIRKSNCRGGIFHRMEWAGAGGSILTAKAKAKATEMSNTTLAPETRLFNRFSLRAMREILLEADRETKDDGRRTGKGKGGGCWLIVRACHLHNCPLCMKHKFCMLQSCICSIKQQ